MEQVDKIIIDKVYKKKYLIVGEVVEIGNCTSSHDIGVIFYQDESLIEPIFLNFAYDAIRFNDPLEFLKYSVDAWYPKLEYLYESGQSEVLTKLFDEVIKEWKESKHD